MNWAFPLAWIVMSEWIQNFVYKTNIRIDAFVLALALFIVGAFLAVSFQSIKAALENPVNAIWYAGLLEFDGKK